MCFFTFRGCHAIILSKNKRLGSADRAVPSGIPALRAPPGHGPDTCLRGPPGLCEGAGPPSTSGQREALHRPRPPASPRPQPPLLWLPAGRAEQVMSSAVDSRSHHLVCREDLVRGSRSIVRLFCYRPASAAQEPASPPGGSGLSRLQVGQVGGLLEAPATPTPAHSLGES